MRIGPNLVPTSIASPMALQTQRVELSAEPPVSAPAAETVRPEVLEPMVVNLVGAKVELLPNELARVVDKMNETARIFNNTLRFEMGEGNRVKVRVIDSVSGQVVREIPPDNFLETFTRMQDVIGVMLDQRV